MLRLNPVMLPNVSFSTLLALFEDLIVRAVNNTYQDQWEMHAKSFPLPNPAGASCFMPSNRKDENNMRRTADQS
jgi:hypothetical protein